MKQSSLLIIFTLLIQISFPYPVTAGPGDTTTVQTFTFGSPLEGKFLFPDSTHRWEKILMYYTLKCNPAQSPACGEWDYLTYTYLYRHTGRFDSILYSHPNFLINGTTPDTLMYMNSPSWSYKPWFEKNNQTVPVTTGTIGTGTSATTQILSGAAIDSRAQILWKRDELLAAGIHAGEITGIRFNFESAGRRLKKLTIRIKASSLDSLAGPMFDDGGFTEVFRRNSSFPITGWQVLPFSYPFTWDGTSNILLDISYEEQQGASQNVLKADSPGFPSVIISGQPDFNLNFRDNDFVKVPASVFNTIDSAITVAFWIYGDPARQPQNNTVFEGIDSAGRRIINVHLPWSDGKIYWDAGADSNGYDRLYQQVNDPSMYRGKWNHWTFVKDAVPGRMKVYFNGELWRILTGKHKAMKGITTFRIGSNGAGNDVFYDGMIDEFMVFNKALSDTAVREFMYRDISPSHPDYGNLAACFRFNEGSGFQTTDASPGSTTAILRGYPDWTSCQGRERFRNGLPSPLRPVVTFEQGIYDPALLDSIMQIDTVAKSPLMIVLFADTVHPYIPTDTITRWPVYYDNYHYNAQGQATDSTFVPNDGILIRKDQYYYGDPYEILERFELARYITPYGNNLSLGDGWTWIYDLTDYAPLLHDSVHLTAGNWQELLDMKFNMIEGIPPRDAIGVTNIYTGTHGYADTSQHNLPPVKAKIPANASTARLKMRITGHGFGGNQDCSEFCPRTNKLFINGSQAFYHKVWRKCGINPLYPQGGTWLYDRADWCPGAEVSTKNFELTPFVVPGDSIVIDYDLQSGYKWNGQGSWPYYQIESQLITYGHPNFTLDVAMEEILSPNSRKNYNRFNPMCGTPVIAIKNNGSDTLFSADITYGPAGGTMQLYHWTGSLAFQDTVWVTLPPVDWSDWTGGDNRFTFTVGNPNGGSDEYPYNNTMTSAFVIPPTYDNMLVFHFKSNHLAASLSWELEDENGNILYQNGPMEQNTIYIDTFQLQKGCYRLNIRNADGEGLSYWANMPPYGEGTAGYARIKNMDDKLVKSFQGDFGSVIGQSFTVGMTIDVPELNPNGYVNIFPNPSTGKFSVALIYEQEEKIRITVTDLPGREIFRKDYPGVRSETIPVDLSGSPKGIYFVTIESGAGRVIRKIVVD